MRKKYIVVGGLFLLASCFFLVGCSKSENAKESKQLRELKNENEELRKQLKRLLLRAQLPASEKPSEQEEGTGAVPDKAAEEETDDSLTQFICAYIEAQYAYTSSSERVKNIKPYMTDKMYSMYDKIDTGNSYTDKLKVKSSVKHKEVYKITLNGRKAAAVVRVDSKYQVEGSEAIDLHNLVELKLEQDNAGNYLVSAQTIYNISQ